MPKKGMKTKLTHPEFVPIPGDKKRRYVNPESGEVIGVGKYQRIAAREEVPYSPKRKTQKRLIQPGQPTPITEGVSGTKYYGKVEVVPVNRLERYNKMVDAYRTKANEFYRDYGYPEKSRREVMQSSQFKDMYAAYKNYSDRQKGGARHQALIAFGILDEDDEYY